MDKKLLRQQLLAQRDKITKLQQQQAALSACASVAKLPEFIAGNNIAFYYPKGMEFDPLPILELALLQGKNCYLPVLPRIAPKVEACSLPRQLMFARYTAMTKMNLNCFKILEPELSSAELLDCNYSRNENLLDVAKLDIIFMPVVGFDSTGARLGMGGGYYDATLQQLSESMCRNKPKRINKSMCINQPVLVGLAYAFQQVPHIPIEPWDIPMDKVITEHGLIVCGC